MTVSTTSISLPDREIKSREHPTPNSIAQAPVRLVKELSFVSLAVKKISREAQPVHHVMCVRVSARSVNIIGSSCHGNGNGGQSS